MPRGHLKHTVGLSKKSARGGASHSSQNTRGRRVQSKVRHQPCFYDDDTEDEYYSYQESLESEMDPQGIAESATAKKVDQVDASKTCPLCCEIRPLVSLSKKCGQVHEPVCRECLRYMYVVQAQESVSNYPLRCFDTNCRHPIRDAQLLKYNLLHSEKELKRHYRLAALSKGNKGPHIKTVHCPDCDHPRTFTGYPENEKDRFFACFQCKSSYMVSANASTIAAVEAFGSDKFGQNYGCAACPNCKALISKGDGCDHMYCLLCRTDFSWSEARSQTKRHPNIKIANIVDHPINEQSLQETEESEVPEETQEVLEMESTPVTLSPLSTSDEREARRLAHQAVEEERNGSVQTALVMYQEAFNLDHGLEFVLAENGWAL